MSVRHAVLATMSAQGEALKGRTLLQKKLYFLGLLSGEDFGFSPHYYGPYSESAAEQTEALVAAGFVDEKLESFEDMSGPFGEPVRYDYTLSMSGKEIIERRKDILHSYKEPLQLINGHPIANDVKLLAAAAKVYFIVADQGGASVQEIQQAATSLGWRIKSRQIKAVVDYLTHLDLVTTH